MPKIEGLEDIGAGSFTRVFRGFISTVFSILLAFADRGQGSGDIDMTQNIYNLDAFRLSVAQSFFGFCLRGPQTRGEHRGVVGFVHRMPRKVVSNTTKVIAACQALCTVQTDTGSDFRIVDEPWDPKTKEIHRNQCAEDGRWLDL